MPKEIFYILRFLLTGLTFSLSQYSFYENILTPYRGIHHFTFWGTHGVALSFILSWAPIIMESIRQHLDFPTWMIDWVRIWAIFHQQCLILWEFLIFGVYWGCPLHW